jgi:hypothetical protein
MYLELTYIIETFDFYKRSISNWTWKADHVGEVKIALGNYLCVGKAACNLLQW